jgi:LysR family transcriptional activator of glutamate synthase operon
MDTRYIREFAVLAQVCNFGEVAAKLFISQSSLSKHIKSVEEELGATLFDRTGKGIVLNEYGKIFLPYARQMVMLEDHFRKDIYNKRHDADNIIVIGTEYRITNLLTDFRLKHKDYLLSSIEGNVLGEIGELLRTGKCELAFICNLNDPDQEFVSVPYTTDVFVAVLYDSHPLAGRATISLEELRSEDFVMFPPYAVHTCFCMDICQQSGFTPKIVLTGSRGSDVVDLVRQEMGISLLFGHAVAEIDTHGIALVEIAPRVPFDISICYRRDAQLTSGAKLFLRYVQELTG